MLVDLKAGIIRGLEDTHIGALLLYCIYACRPLRLVLLED